jgi:general secretion pathway protein B
MSFILDALKKSETDRQKQGATEFSTIPVSTGNPGAPKWLWIFGALLAVNVVVLGVILLRNDTPPTTPAAMTSDAAARTSATPPVTSMAPISEPASDASPPIEPTFSEQVAAAKTNISTLDAQPAVEAAVPVAVVKRSTRVAPSTYVRTLDEVRLNGQIQMTDLHLDLHVYDERSASRFVFINTAKHREKSQLAEGPTVMEITPDGVILEYQGTIFMLPRD